MAHGASAIAGMSTNAVRSLLPHSRSSTVTGSLQTNEQKEATCSVGVAQHAVDPTDDGSETTHGRQSNIVEDEEGRGSSAGGLDGADNADDVAAAVTIGIVNKTI